MGAFMLAAAWSSTAVVAAEEGIGPAELGIWGGKDVLWVYRRDAYAAPLTQDLLRFAYQIHKDSHSARYWSGPVVVGRVGRAVVIGRALHVFFGDGSYHRYMPDPQFLRQRPAFTDHLDVSLPLQSQPLAVCWDPMAEELLVVITAAQAAELLAAQPATDVAFSKDSEDRSSPPSEGDEAKTPGDNATAAAVTKIETTFAIARYTPRRWVVERPSPDGMDKEAQIHGLLARDGRLHLFFTKKDDATKCLHFMSASPDAGWTRAPSLTLPAGATPAAFDWYEDQPLAIIAEKAPGGATVATARLLDGDWKTGPLLAKNAAEAVRFTSPLAATRVGSSIAVSTVTESGDIQVGTWSLSKGSSEAAPSIVSPLSQSGYPQVQPGSKHLLQYALFLAALAAIFVWRRDKVMVLVPTAPNQQYARVSHRAVALVLDIIILAPALGPILYGYLQVGGGGVPIDEQFWMGASDDSTAWFWIGAVVGAVFAVYAAIFEQAMGATPGKRIVGCSVVQDGGKRCTLRAILIRNAFRPIEFHLPAIALLVFLTPSRQRLGDIFAGTVVVEAAPERPTDDTSAAQESDDSYNPDDSDDDEDDEDMV